MIDKKTYSIEWINNLRKKLGKRTDPKLIEKVTYPSQHKKCLMIRGIRVWKSEIG